MRAVGDFSFTCCRRHVSEAGRKEEERSGYQICFVWFCKENVCIYVCFLFLMMALGFHRVDSSKKLFYDCFLPWLVLCLVCLFWGKRELMTAACPTKVDVSAQRVRWEKKNKPVWRAKPHGHEM